MTKKRRKYSDEFKREAVRLVLEEDYTIAGAARNLDLNQNVLGRWVKAIRQEREKAFTGGGELRSEEEEIRKLRKENRELRMEREILKKAAAFFAKEGR